MHSYSPVNRIEENGAVSFTNYSRVIYSHIQLGGLVRLNTIYSWEALLD